MEARSHTEYPLWIYIDSNVSWHIHVRAADLRQPTRKGIDLMLTPKHLSSFFLVTHLPDTSWDQPSAIAFTLSGLSLLPQGTVCILGQYHHRKFLSFLLNCTSVSMDKNSLIK